MLHRTTKAPKVGDAEPQGNVEGNEVIMSCPVVPSWAEQCEVSICAWFYDQN